MAVKTKCQTPGAIFHTEITDKKVACQVDLPESLNLTKKEAELLDTNLHNALELVLAPFFFAREIKTKEIV